MKAVAVLLALAAAAHADPFVVEAKPATLAWHVGKPVDVALRVVNASARVQTFQSMSCSWDEHWKSGDDAVTWNSWDCTKNGPQTITLGPGQAFEKKLAMHATATGRHTLRMSFTPPGRAPTWSSPVVITVER
jgi:hypothetical protein